jgi:hypothetical protein
MLNTDWFRVIVWVFALLRSVVVFGAVSCPCYCRVRPQLVCRFALCLAGPCVGLTCGLTCGLILGLCELPRNFPLFVNLQWVCLALCYTWEGQRGPWPH